MDAKWAMFVQFQVGHCEIRSFPHVFSLSVGLRICAESYIEDRNMHIHEKDLQFLDIQAHNVPQYYSNFFNGLLYMDLRKVFLAILIIVLLHYMFMRSIAMRRMYGARK